MSQSLAYFLGSTYQPEFIVHNILRGSLFWAKNITGGKTDYLWFQAYDQFKNWQKHAAMLM